PTVRCGSPSTIGCAGRQPPRPTTTRRRTAPSATRRDPAAMLMRMSEPSLYVTGRLVLPDRVLDRGYVACARGRIVRVGSGRPRRVGAATVVDAGEGYVTPGFIDIHVHGGDGAAYMDGPAPAVRVANRAHLRHATTTIFPTTTTGTPAEVARMIRACGAVARRWQPSDGARIGGVHLYGPYFADNKVG